MGVNALIQSSGFAVQLVTDGEPLTCPASIAASRTINAVVNRNIVKGKDFLRSFRDVPADFDVLGLTEIEFLQSDATNPPAAGQEFVDQSNFSHRVRYVTRTDFSWVCYCTPWNTVVTPP